jgi:hypothetical protein
MLIIIKNILSYLKRKTFENTCNTIPVAPWKSLELSWVRFVVHAIKISSSSIIFLVSGLNFAQEFADIHKFT